MEKPTFPPTSRSLPLSHPPVIVPHTSQVLLTHLGYDTGTEISQPVEQAHGGQLFASKALDEEWRGIKGPDIVS
jgi:hypothetical protein